ncbi:acyl-CoA thioesterase [Williamsia deligens]|uniref:Acyl-CoA thioesterase n=1 Tax=Williamsia deligens TaxID=321325 RepID=A0ABW3GB60_9NOCA|nr:acyl-CoA thioester hydrolase [Williamsia deligens]
MGTDHELRRTDFAVHRPMTTRWSDNDMYGHLNNAVYYQLFDTAVNGWLADGLAAAGVTLDPARDPVRNVVVESGCRFLDSVAFPEPVTVGLAVDRLGTSSVTYDLAVFTSDDGPPSARGRWVHVYVDAESRRPVPVPDAVRGVLTGALRSPDDTTDDTTTAGERR